MQDTIKTNFGNIIINGLFYWYGAEYKKIEPNVAVDIDTGIVIIFNDTVRVYTKTEEGENKENGNEES
jgi:hypothetical protein